MCKKLNSKNIEVLFELQVIQEIDDMMQETPSSEGDLIEYNEALEKGKEVLSQPLYEESKQSQLFKPTSTAYRLPPVSWNYV